MYLTGIESFLIYGALFGPLVVVMAIITTHLNERNQSEIDFLRTAQEKLSLENALREAELRRLNAQIKPHFLFNTLNTIRNFVLIGRQQEAMEVVEALSTSFRYALERSAFVVPLKGELKYLDSYLQIQRARFGPRLQVELETNPASAGCDVPYMAVQTLVENAIEHAVEVRPDPTLVRVRISACADRLELCVCDDGPGTASPVDEDLLRAVETHPLLLGVGLKNLWERLHHQFGDQAELLVRSRPGEGFRVTIRMPLLVEARRVGQDDQETERSGRG